MIINYTVQAILELCPGAQLSMQGDEYSNIEWLETERELPSEEEVVKKIIELKYQEEVNEYQRQRADEYPSYPDQFDKIYHSGVNAWKTQIKTVKDKYPKQTMDATELQTRKDKAIFDLQTERYIKSTTRLSQYKLSEGRPEVKDEDDVVTQTAIEPLESTIEVSTTNSETMEVTTETVPNPVIVKDEEERTAAQSVVDATPQSVIDSINN
jgi:hypothetical protein